jgi:hypothetical protein
MDLETGARGTEREEMDAGAGDEWEEHGRQRGEKSRSHHVVDGSAFACSRPRAPVMLCVQPDKNTAICTVIITLKY